MRSAASRLDKGSSRLRRAAGPPILIASRCETALRQKTRFVRPYPGAPVDEIWRNEQSRGRAEATQQRIGDLVGVAVAVVNRDGGQSRLRPSPASMLSQSAQWDDVVTPVRYSNCSAKTLAGVLIHTAWAAWPDVRPFAAGTEAVIHQDQRWRRWARRIRSNAPDTRSRLSDACLIKPRLRAVMALVSGSGRQRRRRVCRSPATVCRRLLERRPQPVGDLRRLVA